MKRRKHRLNPKCWIIIYWIIQYLGAGLGLVLMFFVPYIVERIFGGC